MQADNVLKCEVEYTLDVGDKVHVKSISACTKKTQSCRSPEVASVFYTQGSWRLYSEDWF